MTPVPVLHLRVIRVQVQTDRIKPGIPPTRRYRPEVLKEVAALRIDPDGVVGIGFDGVDYLDVHHAQHPHSRNVKGRNGISIMTTGDYAALRQRYGPHLTDGIAGESILLDFAPGLAHRAMPAEMSVVGNDVIPARALRLTGVHIAKPCVEFTRFCLAGGGDAPAVQDPAAAPAPGAAVSPDFSPDVSTDDIRVGLVDLGDGARGYKMTTPEHGVIRPGDYLQCDLADEPGDALPHMPRRSPSET